MKRLRHFDVSENEIDKVSAQELRVGLSSLKLLVSFNVGGHSGTPRTPRVVSHEEEEENESEGGGSETGGMARGAGGDAEDGEEDWSTGDGIRGNSFRSRRSPGNTRQTELGLRQRHSNVGDRRSAGVKPPSTPQERVEREEQALNLA
jgi:hypothetical protein